MKKFLALVCSILMLATCSRCLAAPAFAGSWVLLDGYSNSVLLENNGREKRNPGELVNLMTLYTAMEIAAETGKTLADSVQPGSLAVLDSASSKRRIFLIAGKSVQLGTLLRAVAVLGAEDAALAAAEHLCGSRMKFASEMNRIAAELGLEDSHFTSPVPAAGQRTSAMDLAKLASAMRKKHPQAYAWTGEREFEFQGHSQRNRNMLLWRDNEIEGMAANSANTEFVAAWARDSDGRTLPRSLFSAMLGGRQSDETVNEALNILRAGRVDFETIKIFDKGAVLSKLEVMKGNRNSVEVLTENDVWVTVPRKMLVSRGTGGFTTKIEYRSPIIAPVAPGDNVGVLKVGFENLHLADYPVSAAHEVAAGSTFSRFIDSMRMRAASATEDKTNTKQEK